MAKKRGHGEGSIYRRKDGRWVGEIFLGFDQSGKKKVLRFYGKTREEVQNELIKALRDRQLGVLGEPARQTVGQFLQDWLENSVKGSVRPRTLENYRYAVSHMMAIARVPLVKLTPQHIQRMYREKQEAGLTRTVSLMHSVLHKALGQAVKWGLVPRNVVEAVNPPRVPRKEFRPLSPEEVSRFLEAAKDDRLYALYVLAVSCGLRLGELLGLKWDDVDLAKGAIRVARQLQWIKGTGPVFSEPKSAKARRTIVLPANVQAVLRRHRTRQAEERLKLGDVWQDWGLVFTTTIGTPLDPRSVYDSFYPLLEKARLPRIRFHDLRHTCATLLLAQGVHPKIVQEQLGHSQVNLTLDTYSHVTAPMLQEAAEKMDAILGLALKPRK